jgi:hypothetical protein
MRKTSKWKESEYEPNQLGPDTEKPINDDGATAHRQADPAPKRGVHSVKNFRMFVLAMASFLAGMSLASFQLDVASAESNSGTNWPIKKIGSTCYKLIYRETWHKHAGNAPSGNLTGCSGCFYGYDSESKVVMYRPVPCSR